MPNQISPAGNNRLKGRCTEVYDAFKLRIHFLSWKVHVELLEVFVGACLWILFIDFTNLSFTHLHNGLYDHMTHILPPSSWAVMLGTLALAHLVAVLYDQLRLRMVLMAVAFLLLTGIALSVWGTTSYALGWKLLARDAGAAFWAHVRLREQYAREARARKGAANDTASGQTG